MAGKLSYVLPSVMELFNAPYHAFNGDALPNGVSSSLIFFNQIVNQDENLIIKCAT